MQALFLLSDIHTLFPQLRFQSLYMSTMIAAWVSRRPLWDNKIWISKIILWEYIWVGKLKPAFFPVIFQVKCNRERSNQDQADCLHFCVFQALYTLDIHFPHHSSVFWKLYSHTILVVNLHFSSKTFIININSCLLKFKENSQPETHWQWKYTGFLVGRWKEHPWKDDISRSSRHHCAMILQHPVQLSIYRLPCQWH